MVLRQFSTLVTIPAACSSVNLSVVVIFSHRPLERLERLQFAMTERFTLERTSGIVTSVENCARNVY